ncbi:MAG: hypothetical protein CMH82_02895 [Nocardioides sp.]|nr:hypothetical protein [Nocardioides sp.]|tara:strand:+ start:476 stop:790 length:315 start_codon:yes stop_codon:yes gene_type:complete
MQNEKVPEWAIDEALKRCGVNPDQKPFSDWRDATYARAVRLFAAHIAEHEEPPVDDLYEALKAVVEMGRYDTREQTELLRSELKDRGLEVRKIELARKEDSHAG